MAGGKAVSASAKMTSSSSASPLAAGEGVVAVGVADNRDHAPQLLTSAPVFVRRPQSASVVEGDRVKVTCQVKGHPRPRVRWLKDGRPLEMALNSRVKVRTLNVATLRYVTLITVLSAGVQSIVMCMSVCLSVCPLTKLENQTLPMFCPCCLWLWLKLALIELRYVMYFRFS